jgi:hypothetical protein
MCPITTTTPVKWRPAPGRRADVVPGISRFSCRLQDGQPTFCRRPVAGDRVVVMATLTATPPGLAVLGARGKKCEQPGRRGFGQSLWRPAG